jgi:hypothetical protein
MEYDKKTKILTISHYYNEELKDMFEDTKIIFFDYCDNDYHNYVSEFNQPITKYPKTVTHISFANSFNQPIDNLPESLIYLNFCVSVFDQPIDKLPKNLKYLGLSESFNQPVDNLPDSLTYLYFDYCFNQKVDKLPKNLFFLSFGRQTPVRLAHPKIFIIFEMSFF